MTNTKVNPFTTCVFNLNKFDFWTNTIRIQMYVITLAFVTIFELYFINTRYIKSNITDNR